MYSGTSKNLAEFLEVPIVFNMAGYPKLQ